MLWSLLTRYRETIKDQREHISYLFCWILGTGPRIWNWVSKGQLQVGEFITLVFIAKGQPQVDEFIASIFKAKGQPHTGRWVYNVGFRTSDFWHSIPNIKRQILDKVEQETNVEWCKKEVCCVAARAISLLKSGIGLRKPQPQTLKI